MINLLFQRAILGSPLGSQVLNIYRSIGSFIKGKWTASPYSPSPFAVQGIAYPSSQKELDMVPEGDRIKGAITFITVEELYVTSSVRSGISDEIEWNGDRYKIFQTWEWKDYGYCMSIAERIKGD